MNLAKFLSILVLITTTVTQTMNTEFKDVHTVIRTRRSIRRYKPISLPMNILKNCKFDNILLIIYR